MASPEEIQEVKDMLGADADADGWTDAKIEELLDVGKRKNEIARSYWEFKMTRTSNLADVSESGSSRKLSQLMTNASALAAYHQGADAAANPANQPSSVCREIRRV